MASTSESYSREENMYMARLALEAERHEEMVGFMSNIVHSLDSSEDLTVEERTFLCVAHRNVVDSRRMSWRAISKVLDRRKRDNERDKRRISMATYYLSMIQRDLNETCCAILNLLDSRLIPNSSSKEAKVFNLKTKGDFHRYLAECGIQETKNNDDAFCAYIGGRDLAVANGIEPGNQHRLALELNFAVFYHDSLGFHQKALDFSRGIIRGLPPDKGLCTESLHLVKLMQENIYSWIILDEDVD